MNIVESILLVLFFIIVMYGGILCLVRSASGNDDAREQLAQEQEQDK